MAKSAKVGSPSQDMPPRPIADIALVDDPDLVDEQNLPDERDDDEAHHLRHEEQAAEEPVRSRPPLDEKRQTEARLHREQGTRSTT